MMAQVDPFPKANLLLVDDTPANLLALRAILDDLGQNVVEASSGEGALGHVQKNDFAAILLDVQMHGLDGFETAKRIRMSERSRHTPIIFLTAYESDRAQIEEAYSLGAVDYLVKPLVPVILRAKVVVFIELFQKAEQVRRQSIRLGELERKELRSHLATQYECARAMAEAATVDDATQRVLRAIGERLGWDFGALWQVDATADLIRNVQTWHASFPSARHIEAVTRGRALAHGEGLPGRVWAAGKATSIKQLAHDKNFPRLDSAMQDGFQSGLAFPIALGEEVLGAMEFLGRETREPDGETMRMLASIGSQLGQFIHRKRAEELVVTRARQLEVLSSASQRVNAVLDVAAVMRTLVASALELAEADMGAAGLMKDGVMIFKEYNEKGSLIPLDLAFAHDDAEGIASWIIRERTHYVTNDAANDPVIRPELRQRFGITSSIGMPVFNRDGELIACFIIHNKQGSRTFGAEDITALHGLAAAAAGALENARLFEQLRETEARNRQLADNLPSGFIYQILQRADGTGGFSYVSGGVESLLGIFPYQVIDDPTNLYRLILEEDAAHVAAAEAAARSARKPFECQFRTRARGGEIRWLHCRSAPHDQPDGNVVWDGIAIDITDRVRAEEALHAAKAQLQLVTDTMAAAVVRCSRDLRYVWVSRGYAAWIGRPAEEINGRPIVDVLGPQALETIRPYIRRVLDGEQVAYESALDYPDVGPRWISASYVPTYDGSDRPDGWVAVVMDITQRKKLEDALRDANRRKDEFLAMLAHELRNPLAPIRNAMEILRLRGGDPATVHQLRDMIDRQVGHLTHLVDDLLDVSRIVRGKIHLRKAHLDLARVVRAIADDRKHELQAAGLRLDRNLPDTPVWISGDATRITQILDNLLGNAIKFTPSGGVITLQLKGDRERNVATLSVRDTGIGIEQEMLPRLFESFSQADRSLDRSRGGLGLGLVLVKGLVELHDGGVKARSDGAGQGSEFTIQLPMVDELPALDAKPAVIRKQTGKRFRVLVVEDNRDAADSLRMFLELVGYEVAVAYSGTEGLAAAKQAPPDIVVCDLGLPGLDGFAVATALRGHPQTARARLIAVTGYGQEEDRRKALAAGFDDHIVKPADPEKLLSKLEMMNKASVP